MVPGMADVEHQGWVCGESFMLIYRFVGSESPLFDWLGKGGLASREDRNPARPPRLPVPVPQIKLTHYKCARCILLVCSETLHADWPASSSNMMKR